MPAAAQLASRAADPLSNIVIFTPFCASRHAHERPMIPAPTTIKLYGIDQRTLTVTLPLSSCPSPPIARILYVVVFFGLSKMQL